MPVGRSFFFCRACWAASIRGTLALLLLTYCSFSLRIFSALLFPILSFYLTFPRSRCFLFLLSLILPPIRSFTADFSFLLSYWLALFSPVLLPLCISSLLPSFFVLLPLVILPTPSSDLMFQMAFSRGSGWRFCGS